MMRLSRSKVELFLQCPRCFYLDLRYGVRRPGSPPFSLNLAVDELLKKEFDIYREKAEVPPILKENGLDLIPYQNQKLAIWRENFKGISFQNLDMELFGAVDDIWVNSEGELSVVDYKASAKRDFRGLEGSSWREQYQRQLSFYQWLLINNGYKVSKNGYFVLCNAKLERPRFDSRLEFDISIKSYKCDPEWVEPCLLSIKKCLEGGTPPVNPTCEYCSYGFKSCNNLGFDF